MFVNGNDKVGSAKAYATGREIKLEKENKLLASALLEADKAFGYVEYMSSMGDSDFYRRASDKRCKKTRNKIKEVVELAREIVNKEQE